LPGERFDSDQQCMLKYGKESVRSKNQNIGEICRDLHCQRDRYTWTSHPALEGTNCGDYMVNKVILSSDFMYFTNANCLVVPKWSMYIKIKCNFREFTYKQQTVDKFTENS
jgi:hypothetical protein